MVVKSVCIRISLRNLTFSSFKKMSVIYGRDQNMVLNLLRYHHRDIEREQKDRDKKERATEKEVERIIVKFEG